MEIFLELGISSNSKLLIFYFCTIKNENSKSTPIVSDFIFMFGISSSWLVNPDDCACTLTDSCKRFLALVGVLYIFIYTWYVCICIVCTVYIYMYYIYVSYT